MPARPPGFNEQEASFLYSALLNSSVPQAPAQHFADAAALATRSPAYHAVARALAHMLTLLHAAADRPSPSAAAPRTRVSRLHFHSLALHAVLSYSGPGAAVRWAGAQAAVARGSTRGTLKVRGRRRAGIAAPARAACAADRGPASPPLAQACGATQEQQLHGDQLDLLAAVEEKQPAAGSQDSALLRWQGRAVALSVAQPVVVLDPLPDVEVVLAPVRAEAGGRRLPRARPHSDLHSRRPAVQVLVCKSPQNTVGLGDAISASAILRQL